MAERKCASMFGLVILNIERSPKMAIRTQARTFRTFGLFEHSVQKSHRETQNVKMVSPQDDTISYYAYTICAVKPFKHINVCSDSPT